MDIDSVFSNVVLSNSSSNNTFIAVLNSIATTSNRYLSVFIFIFGSIGNILNLLVLSQRSLRLNSCAWLFLVASVVNLVCIITGLSTRVLSGWGTDPTIHITWFCKLRALIVFSTRTISIWLITLATIDRWLLSNRSAHLRQKSTLKNAQKWAIIIITISTIIYAQTIYCYDTNMIGTPVSCYSKEQTCRLMNHILFASITVSFPVLLMTLFGLLTISNVRKSYRRTHAAPLRDVKSTGSKLSELVPSTAERRLKRKTDHSLLRMLLVQIVLLVIFTFPLSMENLYSSIIGENKSPEVQAANNFIYGIGVLIFYLSNGMPFYIYTLFGGKLFQKALYDLLQLCKRKIMFR